MGFISEELVTAPHPEGLMLKAKRAAATAGAGAGAGAGYGTDPNLVTPVRPWPLTLSGTQRAVLGLLSDIVLPGTGPDDAPSKLNIADFFDEWLSAPYPTQQADRANLLDGLIELDRISVATFGLAFDALSSGQRRAMVVQLSKATGKVQIFFARLRYLVVGGYFTTDVGMAALGYRGNVPLSGFPPVSQDALLVIDEQLAFLGLERDT